MSKKNWWQPLLFVMVVGLSGVFFMGIRTYQDAPPIPDFVNSDGAVVVSQEDILAGQAVFQKYALMNYGSMFGDGASRGPDFTADALHRTATAMRAFYLSELAAGGLEEKDRQAAVDARVRDEIRRNTFDAARGRVQISGARAEALSALRQHYRAVFAGRGADAFRPALYIADEAEVDRLSDFFFWGAWVCGAERPGESYSYTHNWPYDPLAGNLPSAPVLFWSVIGSLGLIAGIGFVLYLRGRLDRAASLQKAETSMPVATAGAIGRYAPSAIQVATFKFFAVAAVLFLLQVLAGALTIHDFIGLTRFGGLDVSEYLPVTVVRSWHVQLSLLWISTCWIAGSIFVLPIINVDQPRGQKIFVDGLFALLVVIVAGSLAGELLGPMGKLGPWWHFLGNQGWEFVELGKLWQILLFAAFALWAFIMYRGARPVIHGPDPLVLPNWLFYSIVAILVLFLSSFVATPRTNFVIADFWRWCVIHMWAEAFFEVFTTALLAYFMYMMGLVSKESAGRVVYLATLLFLGSGILGISHNFYWNAKPVVTLALGSVFSTLQVVPLVMLTLDAWRFKNMPKEAMAEGGRKKERFAQDAAFLFLLGVNFWNFVGAGVFGFIINLPIVNYYEHGTYLTVNHGHAALMGVYGNLAVAAMAFCARYVVRPERWSDGLLKCVFVSLNLGLVLMVVMDLFPAGVLQLGQVLEHGLWYARSHEFVLGMPFQTLTWMRAVGGYLFLLGGVLPLVYFMLSRWPALKCATPAGRQEEALAATEVGAA